MNAEDNATKNASEMTARERVAMELLKEIVNKGEIKSAPAACSIAVRVADELFRQLENIPFSREESHG